MTNFAWALVGPGAIAHRFAEAVYGLPGTTLRRVLGRESTRAADFARHWSRGGKPAPQVAHHLADLLADSQVDAVYIATPHASHAEFIRACLAAGKPVLCEKPLVPTAGLARELVALARQRRVFLMEALWTRFLPIYVHVQKWLQAGAIGKVHTLQSSFCISLAYEPSSRLFNPALAGGTLLDIGIYNLAMTRWVLESSLGACPEPLSLHVAGVLAPTGVDQRVAGTLLFPHRVVSQFVCAFDGEADNSLRIFGTQGTICLPQHFWQATEAVLTRPGETPVMVHAPLRINGFEEEIEETMRCVRAGLSESARMPHAETLALIGWIDEMRRQLGVCYPFE